MVWAVFTETVAGAGYLAGDYYGASGEVTLAAGLGANVLVGGSNRTIALQPISIRARRDLISQWAWRHYISGRRGSNPGWICNTKSRQNALDSLAA
jgi:uncharacterized protein DUF992